MAMEVAKVLEIHVPDDDDSGREVTLVVSYPNGRVRYIAVEVRGMTHKMPYRKAKRDRSPQ